MDALYKTGGPAAIAAWMRLAAKGLLFIAIAVPAVAAAPSAPSNLLLDDVANPVGTEAVPYFGWLDDDTNANEIQTGYEILVATTQANLDANLGDAWDSGEVQISQENHVTYAGTPLTADTQYFWKVRTWDREGNAGPYSTNATFVVGLIANTDWSGASWIERNTSVSDDYTYYRKSAVLPAKTVQRATVYVTSVHKYALYVNGTLVGQGPAYAFPQYQLYNAYDITPLVTPGTTNLFAMFNHWFGGGSGRAASSRGVLMMAIIHYTDGTSTNIATDGTWLQSQATSWIVSNPNPVARGGSGDGYIERIDARNLTPTWNTSNFDDSAWANATVIGPMPNSTWPGPLLPDLTRIVETVLTAMSITPDESGSAYVVDLGKVYSGVPLITFSGGTSGTTINLGGGFALLGSGDIDTSQNQSTTMTYFTVLNGGTFTFQPAEYLTMRYFVITNPPMPITTNNFAFVERNSQLNDAASSFTSSNATLNAVWDMMKHTLPVDAQEEFIDSMRQKGGFLGDGFQESLAAIQVEDERVLTRRRLNEFIESMAEFWSTPPANVGRVNACYPDNENSRDIPDYTQMYLDWVWEYYMQSGDLAFLATNYTALTNIAQYVNRDLNPATGLITNLLGGTQNGVVSTSYEYGIIDWPPDMQFGYDLNTVRGGTGCSATVIDGWAWEDYDIVSRIANELGNTADSATYRAMANALQSAMNTNLLNASGVYVDGLESNGSQSAHASQHANAFPLSLGIVPPVQQSSVIQQVDSLGMSVSALGILQLERALGEANQGPTLLNLYTNANQYGWARILSLGGTATWESWTANTDGNSESHGWGAVGLDGYVRYILGVKPLLPQFEQVQIMPLDFGGILPGVSGSLLTDRGTITIEWDRTATLYHLAVTIPVNVTATVYVPQTSLTNNIVTVDGTNVTGTLTNLAGTANGYLGVSGIGSGTHNIQRVIQTPPVAAFIGAPTNGVVPLTVTFTNLSTDATNFVWNFGDGNMFSTDSNTNVTDTYENAGNYTVILIATGPGGTNSLTNTAYIAATTQPPPFQTYVTNSDTGGSLTAGASWVGGVAPGASNIAVFDSTITKVNPSNATNVLGANTNWGGIQILNPALPIQISAGNIMTLNGLNSVGIDLSQAANALILNCPVTLNSTQTWLVASSQALTLGAAVSGTGPLTFNNASGTANGTIILSAGNSYSGGTVINAGIVQAKSNTSFGTGTVTNNGGAILLPPIAGLTIANNIWLTGTSIIDQNNYTGSDVFSGTFGGNGTVIITNLAMTSSTVFSTLTVGGAVAGTMNNFTGRIICASTNIAGLPTSGFLRFNSGGTVDNTGNAQASFNLGASPSQVILCTRNGETANLGELTGGPGTAVEGPRNAGTTIWSIGGLNTSTTFAGTIINQDATESATGLIAGLTKVGTGTLTLTGPNTYSGPTAISTGTLQIGSGGTNGTLGTAAITIAGGATLAFDRSDTYKVTNNISNAGTLTIAGGGTIAYTGSDTGSGSIFVTNATLAGSGSFGGPVTIQAGGVLAPGAGVSTAGTVLTINSSLIFASGSASIMKVSHNNHNNDQVLSSSVSYGGVLTVITNVGDAPLALNDTFKLFNASSYPGTGFGNPNFPLLAPGLAWSNSLAFNGTIQVVLAPPIASFTGAPTNLFVTQTVTFTDASTGNITNWIWNFGDGNVMTNNSNASVAHAYATAGSYSVTLTVSGAGGSNSSTRTGYILLKPNPVLGVATLTGGKLAFSGTNGPAGMQYRILTTTNVALPLGNWTPVWTNVFGTDGTYGYTNTPGLDPAAYFLLTSP